MGKAYQTCDAKDSRKLAEFLAKEGQVLLPMLDLVTRAEIAVDEVIDVVGRATLEAVLLMSAEQVAGPRHPGKAGGAVRRHGRQPGVVTLSNRKVRVEKPRLRRKGPGVGAEVEVPVYEAMQADGRLGRRIVEILMHGVSTRSYREVLPEVAEAVGISKSAVSREFIDASEEALKALAERRFDDLDLLILYIDGLVFGDHHVLSAIGVAADGRKHVLGLVEGASENAAAAKALLEDLVARGVKPAGVEGGRRRLFVIDGSKALRAAVDAVYGTDNPVQRCRKHKVRNVCDHVPKHLRDQVKAAMRAAYRLEPSEGMARLRKQAEWLEVEHPSAAASLREGLEETFTVNALGLPPALRRCLATTNLIESPQSGVRQRTRRVRRWRDGAMALRWAATAWVATEKRFRRIMGYQHLWILKAYLDDAECGKQVAASRKVG
jgi:transposase-like protein